MIPLVIAAEIWGETRGRHFILVCSDNMAVVNMLKYGLCHDRHLAFCFRELAIGAVLNNFMFTAIHIPGKFNKASDALSHLNLQPFKSLVSDSNSDSLPVPTSLLHKILFPAWTTNVYLMSMTWALSTFRSYSSGRKQFLLLCEQFGQVWISQWSCSPFFRVNTFLSYCLYWPTHLSVICK